MSPQCWKPFPGPKCPFCGYEAKAEEGASDDHTEWACPNCERKYDLELRWNATKRSDLGLDTEN